MSLGGFESELQIEERRKLRQEEWERVRTADQPERKKILRKKSISLEMFMFLVFERFINRP